jgi:hypothetical protein
MLPNYIEVLRSNLPHNAMKLAKNDSYHFQHDNDPKHTTKKEENGYCMMFAEGSSLLRSHQTLILSRIHGICWI